VVARIVAKMATQQDLAKGLQISSQALVEVEWLDACAHMNVDKLDLDKLSELLCVTQTLGKVVAQDEKVICIATNISAANGLDLIAIPVKWIEKIKILGG
tara:strand:- start:910 stop:1209 length:300 start_codon:yes stop_codon:yes gene_type:complete